jgi:hypothetical protein
MLLVALNWYVGANVLLAVAYMLLSAIGFASGKLSHAAPYRVQIWYGRAFIFAAILLPLGASLLGYQGSWPQPRTSGLLRKWRQFPLMHPVRFRREF